MSHPMRACQGAALRPEDALAFHVSVVGAVQAEGATVLGQWSSYRVSIDEKENRFIR